MSRCQKCGQKRECNPFCGVSDLDIEMKFIKLETENKKLRECVELYADRNSYNLDGFPIGFCAVFPTIKDDYDRDTRIDKQGNESLSSHGGKLARQTLKELGGG